MEGLGVTRAAGLERCFATSMLVLCILCFSLTNSVPERGPPEQAVSGSRASFSPLRGFAARQLAGRAACTEVGCVFACATASPMKTATGAPLLHAPELALSYP